MLYSELPILKMRASCVVYNYDDSLGRSLEMRVNFACYYRIGVVRHVHDCNTLAYIKSDTA